MSISKTAVRLAAAALTVAGLTVGVWAQGATSGSMSATYTVQQIAELEVTPKNPMEENLIWKNSGVGSINAAPSAANFGNLGTIKVRTNSAKWDVLMTTDNGGKMLDKTSVGCWSVPVVDGWGNPTGAMRDSCDSNGAKYLTRAEGTSVGDTMPVILSVAIGIAKQGQALGNTGASDQLFPLLAAFPTTGAGASPAGFVPPVLLDSTAVAKSQVGLTGVNFEKVSFAKKIGAATTGYGSGGVMPTGAAYTQGIYGTTTATTAGDWGEIVNGFFPKPGVSGIAGSGASAPALGANVDPLTEFFYVNVGITEATQQKLQGNKGTFTETFNFELSPNF